MAAEVHCLHVCVCEFSFLSQFVTTSVFGKKKNPFVADQRPDEVGVKHLCVPSYITLHALVCFPSGGCKRGGWWWGGGGREGEEGEAWLSSRQHCNNEPASAIFKTYHQYTTGRLLNINPVVAGGSSGGARVVLRRPLALDHPIKDVLGEELICCRILKNICRL